MLFSSCLAIRLYLEDGSEVPRSLPPTPKRFEKSDTIDIRPGENTAFVFRVMDATPVDLHGKRGMLEVIYDTTSGFSPEYEIWRGKSVSNRLTLTFN